MKKPKFFEDTNMFVIGLFVGMAISTAFASNYIKGRDTVNKKLLKAYEQYYNKTETMLDSIDENRDLDLMDTDLCSNYGVNYLNAKNRVDSLTNKYEYHD